MQSHLGNDLIICLKIKEIMLTNGRAIWGKCPNFPKGLFLSQGTLVASSETVIAQFDKKNQFGTSAFSHNSNFKFWSAGERFMQTLGHKATDCGIQVPSEMSQIFSCLLIWVKTDWIQPTSYYSNFTINFIEEGKWICVAKNEISPG